jgi:hypothetical protein
MKEPMQNISLVKWTTILSKPEHCGERQQRIEGRGPTPPLDYRFSECRRNPHDFSSTWNGISFVSTTCTLHPCTKHLSAEAIGGNFQETLVSEVAASEVVKETSHKTQYDPVGTPKYSDRHRYYTVNASCDIDGVSQDLKLAPIVRVKPHGPVYVGINGKDVEVPSNCTQHDNADNLKEFTAFLQATMNGNCIENLDSSGYEVQCTLGSEPISRVSSKNNPKPEKGDAWWLGSVYNNGNATFISTSKHIQAVAETYTDRMRQVRHFNGKAIFGVGEEETTCSRFSWPWLMLPASLLLLSAMLLMKLVISEKLDGENRPVWKNSTLPTVSTSSNLDLRTETTGLITIKDMEKVAKCMKACLVWREANQRWEFVIEDEQLDNPYSAKLNVIYR